MADKAVSASKNLPRSSFLITNTARERGSVTVVKGNCASTGMEKLIDRVKRNPLYIKKNT